ncbi:MAG TPA: transposase [Candidatus Angelobacter sp.]|nr:transposase [Candidatus Angelobacter sp.]
MGLDWGDQRHVLELQVRGAGQRERLELSAAPEEFHPWFEALGERLQKQPVAIAVEASKGAVIAALAEYAWVVIYPVHPTTSRRFSTAFTPSGAKDDGPDARVLLDVLELHRVRLRALAPQDALTRRVDQLVQWRRKLVDQRTLFTNQLTSVLKEYFPQALSLVGESLSAPLALDFLQRWPQLSALQKARPETVRSFYYRHQVRRPERVEQRLKQIVSARALTTDAIRCEMGVLQVQNLVSVLRTLNLQIEKVEAEMTEAFAAHPDAYLFRSLPGAGAAMAPRLCALFGTDRMRWISPAKLQTYFGIAPVIEKSGKRCWVHWRWGAPTFGRQTLVEWAGISVRFCSWANDFYRAQRAQQKSHGTALRALAFKWLRVLWSCWQKRKPYDDQAYLAKLREHRAPYLVTAT